MADEQTIYISPEDDLTTVRERLERIPTRRVTLVIPAQTQLRSHVAWKLLYARARELGKEVLIVSSDPQVRSVAHAVKFKVAHSLESSTSGRSRPATRPTRSGVGVRSRPSPSSSRTSPARGPVESRGASNLGGNIRSRQSQSPDQWYDSTPESPRTQPEPEIEGPESRPDEIVTGGLSNQPFDTPPTFDASERMYNEPYDFRRETSPRIRPLSAEQIEEPDLLFEDYALAQDIRQAASEKLPAQQPPPTASAAAPGDATPTYRITPLPNIADDPFASMDDVPHPSPIPEQPGSVSIEGYDAVEEYNTGEHVIEDVSEMPTEIIDGKVEYLDDMGEPVPPANASRSPWIERDEQEEAPRVRGVRPRKSSGYLPPSPPVELDEDALPPVEERPTQAPPVVPLPAEPPREAREVAPVNRRVSQPLPPQRSRVPALSKPAPRQPRQQRSAASRTPSVSRIPGVSRTPTARTTTRRRVPVGLLAAILLVLLIIGALAFFTPSADVTITLYSRDFSRPLSLIASPTKQSGAVLAQKITKVFSATGTGKATGSKMVGSAPAKGIVIFTNNGTKPVEIPTDTIVATSGANSIQFQTTADAVISPNSQGNASPPIPVQAVQPGTGGNVPAGSITVIPDNSLGTIAQYNANMSVSDLKLTVTNPQDITGGGMQPATVVKSTDLDSVKNALHQQLLQGDVNAWVKQLSANGIVGKPVVTDETLVNAPQVDQVEENGNFSAGLTLGAAVLLVRNNDLQNAAVAQLQKALSSDKNYVNYTIVSDVPSPVKIDQLKQPTGDANSMTLSFNATAKAAPYMDKGNIQEMIAGKPISNARADLSKIPNVQKVDIKPSPDFIWFVPYWSEHINVIIQPCPTKP